MDRLIRRRPDGVRARGWAGKFVSDIFQEVDEEVRREQLKKLWDRYGNYAVAAAFLLVAAVSGLRRSMLGGGEKGAPSGPPFQGATPRAGTRKSNKARAAPAQNCPHRTSRVPRTPPPTA